MAESPRPARGLGSALVERLRPVGGVELEEPPDQLPRRPPDFE